MAGPHTPLTQVNLVQQTQTATPVRYEGGCHVDYPCWRRPYRHHRSYTRHGSAGSVYIGRNYGTVNITMGGYRPVYRRPRYPYPSPCDADWCDRDGRRGNAWPGPVPGAIPDPRPVDDSVRPVGCGGYPCDQNCGPSCWYERFKNGYCGHGCDTYRERVRFETEDRTIKAPKIIVETRPRPMDRTDAPGCVERHCDDPDRPRDSDRSRDFDGRRDADERADRQRYLGPAYPVQ